MVWFYGDDTPLRSNYFGCFKRVPPYMGSHIDERPTGRNVLIQRVPRLWFPLAELEDIPAYRIVRVEQHRDAWFDVDPDRNEWFENRRQTVGQMRASRKGPM